MQFNTKLFGY